MCRILHQRSERRVFKQDDFWLDRETGESRGSICVCAVSWQQERTGWGGLDCRQDGREGQDRSCWRKRRWRVDLSWRQYRRFGGRHWGLRWRDDSWCHFCYILDKWSHSRDPILGWQVLRKWLFECVGSRVEEAIILKSMPRPCQLQPAGYNTNQALLLFSLINRVKLVKLNHWHTVTQDGEIITIAI